MAKQTYVVVNGNGLFFNGAWNKIQWTEEYPNARQYSLPGAAKLEASMLRVECYDPTIKAVRDYGLETQITLL